MKRNILILFLSLSLIPLSVSSSWGDSTNTNCGEPNASPSSSIAPVPTVTPKNLEEAAAMNAESESRVLSKEKSPTPLSVINKKGVDKAPAKPSGSYPKGFVVPKGGKVIKSYPNGNSSMVSVSYSLALDGLVAKLKSDLEVMGFICVHSAQLPDEFVSGKKGGHWETGPYILLTKKKNLRLNIAIRNYGPTKTGATFQFQSEKK